MRTIKLVAVLMGGLLITFLSMMSNAIAAPVYYSGTGHYYEAIRPGPMTWDQAKTAAESRSYLGVQGHLATITSQGENDFIKNNVPGSADCFLGGFQPAGSPEPAGGWQWVTGEPWIYTNWLP